MAGAQGQGRLQLRGPGLRRLVWPGVDQVDGDAGKDLQRRLRRPATRRRIVVAAQLDQGLVLQRLQAQGQAVHTRFGKAGEPAGLGVRRVRLQAHLKIRAGLPEPPAGGDHLRHSARVHQGGRPAAEEDRGQAPRARRFAPPGEVVQEGAGEGRRLAGTPVAVDVEVAVGADPGAVGPVDIDPEARRVGVRGQARAAFSRAKARVRWLMASLATGSISPKVRSWPSGRKMGS